MPAPPSPGGAGRRRERSGKSPEREERRGGSSMVQVRPRAGRVWPAAGGPARHVLRASCAVWRGRGHRSRDRIGGGARAARATPSAIGWGACAARLYWLMGRRGARDQQSTGAAPPCHLWAGGTVHPLARRPGTPAAIGWQGAGPRLNISACVEASWRPGLDGGRRRLVGSGVSCGEAAASGVTPPGPLPFRTG